PAITVRNVAVEPAVVEIGGEVTFSFEVESLSDEPQNLMIDFVVHYVKASGQLSPKVWKLTRRTLQPGEVLPITKTVSFRPVTTRKYYAGEHAIAPKINGKLFERAGLVWPRKSRKECPNEEGSRGCEERGSCSNETSRASLRRDRPPAGRF
ncbi:MAG: hypothetical protein ACE5LU_06680, partial [Anaerolineae bacterium]